MAISMGKGFNMGQKKALQKPMGQANTAGRVAMRGYVATGSTKMPKSVAGMRQAPLAMPLKKKKPIVAGGRLQQPTLGSNVRGAVAKYGTGAMGKFKSAYSKMRKI